MGSVEDAVLDVAEELLDIIPDNDSDVTDDVYNAMLTKAKELDSLKDRLQ